jgi:SpoVK/Ycf46/Vps4 family AAA+-type ATPase
MSQIPSDLTESQLPINLYDQGLTYSAKAEEYRSNGELEGALINFLLSSTNLYNYLRVKGIPEGTAENQQEPSKLNAQRLLEQNIKWIVPLQEKLQELKKNRNCPEDNKNEEEEKMCKDIKLSKSSCMKFDQISGQQKAKEQIKTGILKPLLFPRLYPFISKGILFYGPPGTGKTLLAKAFVNELQDQAECYGLNIRVLLYAPTGASLKGKYVGETEKNIKKYFDCAEKQARECSESLAQNNCGNTCSSSDRMKYKVISVIFLDEIEAIAGDRSKDDSGMMTNSVNTLLQMMDGVNKYDNVVVMGATNYPWSLDAAILRRFDTKIFVTLPDVKDITELLKIQVMEYIQESLRPFQKKQKCGDGVKDNCGKDIVCKDKKDKKDILTITYDKDDNCEGCCDKPTEEGKAGKEGLCCGDICIINECTQNKLSFSQLFDIYRNEYFPFLSDSALNKIAQKYESRQFSGGDVRNACRYVFRKIGMDANKRNKFKDKAILDPHTLTTTTGENIKNDLGEDKIFKLFSDLGSSNSQKMKNTQLYIILDKRKTAEDSSLKQYLNDNMENVLSLDNMQRFCIHNTIEGVSLEDFTNEEIEPYANWDIISQHLGNNVEFLSNIFSFFVCISPLYLNGKIKAIHEQTSEDQQKFVTQGAQSTEQNSDLDIPQIFSNEEFYDVATGGSSRKLKNIISIDLDKYEIINACYYVAWRFQQFKYLWKEGTGKDYPEIIPENFWGIKIVENPDGKCYLEKETHDTLINTLDELKNNTDYKSEKIFKIKFFGFKEDKKVDQKTFLESHDDFYKSCENEYDVEGFYDSEKTFYDEIIKSYENNLISRGLLGQDRVSTNYTIDELETILKREKKKVLNKYKSIYLEKTLENLKNKYNNDHLDKDLEVSKVLNMYMYSIQNIISITSYYQNIGAVFIDIRKLIQQLLSYILSPENLEKDSYDQFEMKALIYINLSENMPKMLKGFEIDPRCYFTVPVNLKLQNKHWILSNFGRVGSKLGGIASSVYVGIRDLVVWGGSGIYNWITDPMILDLKEDQDESKAVEIWEQIDENFRKNKLKDNNMEDLFALSDKCICIKGNKDKNNLNNFQKAFVIENFVQNQSKVEATKKELERLQEYFKEDPNASQLTFENVKNILGINTLNMQEKNYLQLNNDMLNKNNINALRLLLRLQNISNENIAYAGGTENLVYILLGTSQYNNSPSINIQSDKHNVTRGGGDADKFKRCVCEHQLVGTRENQLKCGLGFRIANGAIQMCKKDEAAGDKFCNNTFPDNDMILAYSNTYKNLLEILNNTPSPPQETTITIYSKPFDYSQKKQSTGVSGIPGVQPEQERKGGKIKKNKVTKSKRKKIKVSKKNKYKHKGGGKKNNEFCQQVDPPAESIMSFGENSNFDMISFNFRESYFDSVIDPSDPSHIKASTTKEKIDALEAYQKTGTVTKEQAEA